MSHAIKKERGKVSPALDAMLSLTEAAAWLDLSVRELSVKSRGKRPKIPGFWINQRVVRFHPRTILAKLASDAGVSFDVVAASFGMDTRKMNPGAA